jgi:hypothetical protein
MTQPLDLAAVLERAEAAYAVLRDDGDGYVPPAVREHFNYDVPALIGALRHRGTQLNLVGIAVNLPSEQATTDIAPKPSTEVAL